MQAAICCETDVYASLILQLVMSREFCSKAEPDILWKTEREALQGEIQHLRHLATLASTSSTCLSTSNGAAPRSSLSAGSNATQVFPNMVQLKREELLKWKTAQLERQVTLLQAALQVDPCKDNPYCLSFSPAVPDTVDACFSTASKPLMMMVSQSQ